MGKKEALRWAARDGFFFSFPKTFYTFNTYNLVGGKEIKKEREETRVPISIHEKGVMTIRDHCGI